MATVHILDAYRDKKSLLATQTRRKILHEIKLKEQIQNFQKISEDSKKKAVKNDQDLRLVFILALFIGIIGAFGAVLANVSVPLSICIGFIAGGLTLFIMGLVSGVLR